MAWRHDTPTTNARYAALCALGWIAALACLVTSVSSTAQDLNDPLALWGEATLYRDEWGTPHVYAETVRALAFVFGYAQAEDHLEGMLRAYRVANGGAAEVWGEAYAASDEFALKLRHAELAQAALVQTDPVTRDLCEGFSLGVNAWMVEHQERVPPWAAGVQPADVLALLHCYLMSMAPFDLPDTYHLPMATESGNAFAIHAKQSTTGEAILVMNPHTDYEGPFQWYEAHLVCRDLDVAGATLFGLPVILQGHNGVLGWALTPNKPDFADVYREPGPRWTSDGTKIAGGQRFSPEVLALLSEMASSTRPYFVRTQDGYEERYVHCLKVPRGPLIGHDRGQSCSYHVGGYGEFGALRQLVDMARARELSEFRDALGMHQLPCFHVIYADREGNIFYLYNAKVGDKPSVVPSQIEDEEGPVGTKPIDWEAPVPGDDPKYSWGSIMPVAALPSLENPASGYIQACGCPPWHVTADSKIAEGDLPHWFARDRDTYRARRARQLLGMGPHSFYEAQSMLYDVLVPFAAEAVPKLLEAAERYPDFVANAHPDLPLGLKILGQWNHTAEANSVGMTFFHVWFAALRGLTAPQIRTPVELMESLVENVPEMEEPALRAASEAAKLMRNGFQSIMVPWGDVHRVYRGTRSEPLAGAVAGEPIFVASDSAFTQNAWRVTYGYGYGMAVKFGQQTEAVSMVPFGASEYPESPHYDDQLDLLVQRRFKVTRFEESDVQRHAESAHGLVIKLRPMGVQGLVSIHGEAPVEARLKISATPPGVLPAGYAPYTLYMEPEIITPEAAVVIDMTIRIPPDRCPLEDLPLLAVCAHDRARGWMALEPQTLDPETRTFTARDRQPHVYVVLGPVRPAEIISPTPAVQTAQERVEEPVTAIEEREPAPGWPQEAWPIPAEPVPEGSPPEPRGTEQVFVSDEHRTGESIHTAVGSAPPAAQPAEEVTTGPAEGTPKRFFVVHDRDRESERKASDAAEITLDESTVIARTSVARGRMLALRLPGLDALFHLSADEPIRARLLLLEKPPVPLPTGMAVFSPCVTPQWMPADRSAEVGITWRLADRPPDKEHFERLALYAYDPEQGWWRVPGQEVDAESGRFTALCKLAHVYAVLGPVDLDKDM